MIGKLREAVKNSEKTSYTKEEVLTMLTEQINLDYLAIVEFAKSKYKNWISPKIIEDFGKIIFSND